ncbi:Protein tyrosine kinase [Rhizoctonia solani]|uniref:Protein tyrosine kinase n=1 Tax=Rhizoctonia solani TaxID=456999 RepID=A0A8H7LJG9_9AGAM|nr:Protein tyrosine kinase [Rhizoctonia solani]
MHSIGMLHGDIKGANVVVMEDGTAKLIDLETSVSEQSAWSFETRGHSLRASIRWVAPEIFQDEPVTTRASDVYGLAMQEIASGKVPWSKISHDIRVIRRVVNGETLDRPAQILDVNGDSLWELLLDCWKLEPKERPSAGSVLRVLQSLPPNCLGPLEIQSESETTQASAPSHIPIIRRCMSMQEIASCLIDQGCLNISKMINEQTFDERPSFTGGSSDIYSGRLFDLTEVCIKSPRRSSNISEDAENRVYISREIYIWSRCHHPNVVPFLGLAVFRNEIAAVSPYFRHGTLMQFLARNPDADRCQLSTQICEGVAYLHSIGIAHGDLKGDNVFVSDSGSALIADLGSADVEGRAVDFTLFMNRCGYTTRWAAPELIKYGVFRCREADIYALGMTILVRYHRALIILIITLNAFETQQTLTGEVPFKYKRQDHMVIMAVIGKREFPKRPLAQIPVDSEHGDKLWDLLCWCWSPELENRPNADQVVKEMRTITRDGLAPTAQD